MTGQPPLAESMGRDSRSGSLQRLVSRSPYYADDYVTLYHADCRHVLPLLESFDLLLTDPPYGIGFAAQPTKWQRRAGQQAEAWDDEAVEGWLLMLALSKGQKQIVWGGNYYDLPPARCLLSWHKPDAPPSMGNVEYAWTNLNQNSRQISHSVSATNAERLGHPTQKPMRVISWAMQQAGEVQTVLDPWAGSGTTLRVAKDLGKHVVGIEIDERHCETAAKRLSQGVLSLEDVPATANDLKLSDSGGLARRLRGRLCGEQQA